MIWEKGMINQGEKTIVFLNAYTRGISGGDLRFIEIAKRVFPRGTEVVTSLLGRQLCEKKGLQAEFQLTSREDVFSCLYLTYLKRIINAWRLLRGRCVKKGTIIYATSDFFPDVLPAFWLRLRSRNNYWVQLVHHLIPNPLSRPGNLLTNLLSFICQRLSFFLIRLRADQVITIGPQLTAKMRRFLPERCSVVTGYNGIDLKEFEDILADGTKTADAVFLGRLHPSKGIEDLLAIWKRFKEAGKDYSLTIIGGGDVAYLNRLREKVQADGTQNLVSLLGYVEEARGYLSSARLFVFPSYEEGWGISICEALASRLPVVAYDLPAYDVYGDSIVKVSQGDLDSFGRQVERLLTDNAYRQQLGEQGYQLVKEYSWDKIARREKELLYEKR